MVATTASPAEAELRAFRREAGVSMPAICRQIFAERGDAIRVRNEKIAVRNLGQIIEATLAIANRKGFAAMSLRDLAHRSGLSLGGLYAYFTSKHALAAVIQQQGQRLIARLLRERVARHSHAGDRLAEAIRTHVLLSEILRPWFLFLYMEARHLAVAERRQAVAMEQATEAVFAAIIRAGQAAGDYRDIEPLTAAAMLKALLQDWYLKHGKHAQRGISATDYAQQVEELMQRYLEAPEAAHRRNKS